MANGNKNHQQSDMWWLMNRGIRVIGFRNHHPNSTNVVSGHVAYIQGTILHSSGGSPGIINENSTISVWFKQWTSCFVIGTLETWNMRIEPSMNQASFSCHYGIYGFLTSKRNGHDCWSSVCFWWNPGVFGHPAGYRDGELSREATLCSNWTVSKFAQTF